MSAKDKFLRGAMILTLAGLMVKIIGSVNRILLSRLLGGEGIGLYQMAYPVYLLLLAISSAGIPIAISIVVAEYLAKEDYGNVRQVFRCSLGLTAGLGLLLALALYFVAGWLVESGSIRDGRAYYALLALLPAIFFATILASFRGFFQGQQLMTPPAVSQIVEQFVRVCTMVILAYVLLPKGLEYAAAGAAFGAVPGSLTGLVVLGYFFRRYSGEWWSQGEAYQGRLESFWTISKKLLLLALPVTCANILVPITSSIDMLLVPNRLVAVGHTIEQATTQFGYLAGMAQPLLMMATIPTMSLSASLVPAVSEAFTLGDMETIRRRAGIAIKLCCLITIPAAIGMSALGEAIALLLYGTAKAGTAIIHSGPAICMLGLQQVTTGLLQGMGHTKRPMVHMLLGIVVKIAAVWVLTNSVYGIAGAAWATNINFALTAMLNIILLKQAGIGFAWLETGKITLAAGIMGLVAGTLEAALRSSCGIVISAVSALLIAPFVYVVLVLLLKIVNRDEMRQMPMLKRFVK